MNTVQVISFILQSWFSFFSLNVEFCNYFWYTLTYWVRQDTLDCLDNFTFWFGSVVLPFSFVSLLCLVKKKKNAIIYWYKSKANFSDIIESAGLSTCCRMTSKLVWAIYRQPFSILTNPPVWHVIQGTQENEDPFLWVVSKTMEGSSNTTSIFLPILLSLVPGLDTLVVSFRHHPWWRWGW